MYRQVCGWIRERDIKVSRHLDHRKNFDDVKQAVWAGFTSVMTDGVKLPLVSAD
ncbi:class II fructose-bisphosphate aldolase [Erwinia amylovora]